MFNLRLDPAKGLNYSGISMYCPALVTSSNESFVLMMKQVPNAKAVGTKTYGSSESGASEVVEPGDCEFCPHGRLTHLTGS